MKTTTTVSKVAPVQPRDRNTMSDFKGLTDSGFIAVADETPSRLLIGSQGQERTGKTDWALRTTPGPIAYIGLDFGHEGVISKHVKEKHVLAWYKNVPPVGQQSEYLKHWLEVNDHIQKAMQHASIRTVVLDSGTDIWELLRLAEFGALNKSGDIKKLYPQINQAYRSLIRMAYDREINMIVTHKSKKLYATKTIMTQKGPQEMESWDGKSYERAGFGEGGYLIQVEIEHLFDGTRKGNVEDKYGLRCLNCRQNPEVTGTELWGSDCSFRVLAQYVFPDSDEKAWL